MAIAALGFTPPRAMRCERTEPAPESRPVASGTTATRIRHMGWRAILILTVTLFTSIARSAPQQDVPSTQQTRNLAPNPTLDRAEALLDSHRTQPAHDLLVAWLKSQP